MKWVYTSSGKRSERTSEEPIRPGVPPKVSSHAEMSGRAMDSGGLREGVLNLPHGADQILRNVARSWGFSMEWLGYGLDRVSWRKWERILVRSGSMPVMSRKASTAWPTAMLPPSSTRQPFDRAAATSVVSSGR